MISRTAESCFWLYRYIERASNMARFITVNQDFVLDVKPKLIERWFPLVIVAGEEQRFLKHYEKKAALDDNLIRDYLTWNEENPVSIFSSIHNARENAHIIRATLSLEIWESINTFWIWLQSKAAKRLFNHDIHEFFKSVSQHCELFQGLFYNSIARDEAFNFMYLGLHLERANQTARIIDVKYHRMSLGSSEQKESAQEAIHWLALLKCCSASDSFLKKGNTYIKRKNVLNFLLLEKSFPRSVMFCLQQAKDCLAQLNDDRKGSIKHPSYFLLTQLLKSLHQTSIDEIIENEVHNELTRIVNTVSDACDCIHQEYFDPDFAFDNYKEKRITKK